MDRNLYSFICGVSQVKKSDDNSNVIKTVVICRIKVSKVHSLNCSCKIAQHRMFFVDNVRDR